MNKFDGIKFQETKLKQLKDQIKKNNLQPKLAIILVGSNPESLVYVSHKQKKAKEIGIEVNLLHFDEKISKEKIIEQINKLNNDVAINGIIIQLPIPETLKSFEFEIINTIDPKKDVDGLTVLNQGLLEENKQFFIPATALAVLEILKSIDIDIKSKNILLIGHSRLVTKPLIKYFLNHHASITVVDEFSLNWKDNLNLYDIIISSAGVPNLIQNEELKPTSILIGVGLKKVNDILIGDFDEEVIKDKVSFFTPTPKGVGPITVYCLLLNVVNSYIESKKYII